MDKAMLISPSNKTLLLPSGLTLNKNSSSQLGLIVFFFVFVLKSQILVFPCSVPTPVSSKLKFSLDFSHCTTIGRVSYRDCKNGHRHWFYYGFQRFSPFPNYASRKGEIVMRFRFCEKEKTWGKETRTWLLYMDLSPINPLKLGEWRIQQRRSTSA